MASLKYVFSDASLNLNCIYTSFRKSHIYKVSLQYVFSDVPVNPINNIEKLRSFKSKENIHKKEFGPYRGLNV